VPISNAIVLQKITTGGRLRVGFQISSTAPVKLRVFGSGYPPRLTFRVSPDTSVRADTIGLNSKTPFEDANLANVLAMFPIRVSGALPPPVSGVLAVGGVNGARAFLRFDVPTILIDSVQVVRASLLVQQLTSRVKASSSDTLPILVNPVVAGPQLTDVLTLTQLVAPASAIGLDTARFVPKDAGLKSIELVNLFRTWRNVGTANSIRAIVIRAAREGVSAGEFDFVSNEGPVALRPKLRITYVPRRGFGLP
jgi:hypothetical protein